MLSGQQAEAGQARQHLVAENATLRQRALPESIACKARVFFAAVYALGSCDRRALQVHEKAFWTRHKRLCAAVGGAKHDRDDFCRVWLCLRKRLPAELSARVLRMAV